MKVYRQTDGYSCGPRSLQIAFSHYKFYPPYKEIIDVCQTTPEYGTDVDNLELAAEFFGYKPDVYENDATTEIIKKYTDLSYPVITMWYAGSGDNHVSVSYSVDKKFVYLIDPSLHLYTEPVILIRRKMLEKCWKNHKPSKWIMAILPQE